MRTRPGTPTERRPSRWSACALAAVAAACLVLVGCGDDEPSGGGAEIDGAQIYKDNCASCHGRNGEGAIGPTLGGGAVKRSYPNIDGQIDVITNGLGAQMPAWGETLSAEEIEAVAVFEREELGQ